MTIATEEDRTIRFLGNNEINVLVSSQATGDNYCVLELIVQPKGGANALHTDKWIETFHLVEGQIEWTLEKDGRLVTWTAEPGETVVVPRGAKHKFVGAGDSQSRMLAVGPAEFEQFFRALAAAWHGPFDREKTPQAVGPVFTQFGIQMCSA